MRMRSPVLLPALLLATLCSASPSYAQRADRFRLTLPLGLSPLEPATQFANAYDGGGHAGVALAIPLTPRVWLRAGVERHWFPYDRLRFFRRMGNEQVDLEGQFGEGATVDWWSIGPEISLWEKDRVGLYTFGTVGRAVRRATGALVWMYCSEKTVFLVRNDTLMAVPYQPPVSCAEARSETSIGGSGFGVQLGAGLRVPWGGRSHAFVETGLMEWLLTPRGATIPLRFGWSLGF